MKRLSLLFVWCLTLTAAAQTNRPVRQAQERQITVSENVAYRTDVGKSTVLDLAQPQFGPQKDRPAILIIHGGGGLSITDEVLCSKRLCGGQYELPAHG